MPRHFDSLVQVLHHVAHNAPNRRKFGEIAALMGKPYSTLANELNDSVELNKFGADHLELLMELADSDEPVLYLARRRNLACIKLPKAGPGAGASCREALKAVKEMGDVMEAYEGALDNDGRVDASERREIDRQVHEAVEQLLTFSRSLGTYKED
ncbi:MAG: phage regulatory CII family protein [Desulfovibrio sp.]